MKTILIIHLYITLYLNLHLTNNLGRPLPYLKETMDVKYQIIAENSQTKIFHVTQSVKNP